ncbi:312_t:CDS:2 [Diversispora eburnea]|uniref:312_t:CDS:1 n=1 Tax=Diversispora eburnea TaxID=1213867 RepID=A0A9N8ZXK2_9GLOM|nr:312_t:CDS:2 [Diversispora eburnea]
MKSTLLVLTTVLIFSLTEISLSIPVSYKFAKRAFTGDATYYDPGLGSCGITSSGSDFVVALVTIDGNPNHNPLCGKQIVVTGPKGSVTCTIVDRCPVCPYGDVDLSRPAFEKIADLSVGRLRVTWDFVGGGSPPPPPPPPPTTTTTSNNPPPPPPPTTTPESTSNPPPPPPPPTTTPESTTDNPPPPPPPTATPESTTDNPPPPPPPTATPESTSNNPPPPPEETTSPAAPEVTTSPAAPEVTTSPAVSRTRHHDHYDNTAQSVSPSADVENTPTKSTCSLGTPTNN